VQTARLLLESSEIGGAVEVARRAGYGDDECMRRAFIRHLGISPKPVLRVERPANTEDAASEMC
jgi:transcriptional regulator GlxA family with amidase domain